MRRWNAPRGDTRRHASLPRAAAALTLLAAAAMADASAAAGAREGIS